MNTSKKIRLWDNSERSRIVINVFWVYIALSLISIISNYFQIDLLENFESGEYSDDDIDANDLRVAVIALGQLGLLIILAIVFLNWFRRAYGNIHRTNIMRMESEESMATWSFFIPFYNLYKPYNIAKEILDGTERSLKKFNPTYTMATSSSTITTWWALFIISNIVGNGVARLPFDTIDELIFSSQAEIVASIIDMISAYFAIQFVKKMAEDEAVLAESVRKYTPEEEIDSDSEKPKSDEANQETDANTSDEEDETTKH